MMWSRNDSWMVTADHGGYVKYWQSNMNNVKMFQAHKEPIRAIRWEPSGEVSPSIYLSCSLLCLFIHDNKINKNNGLSFALIKIEICTFILSIKVGYIKLINQVYLLRKSRFLFSKSELIEHPLIINKLKAQPNKKSCSQFTNCRRLFTPLIVLYKSCTIS